MADPKCATCQRDPKRMNSPIAECSHADCPYRKPVTASPRDELEFQLAGGCRTSVKQLPE